MADDREADEMMSKIRVRVESRAACYYLRGTAGTADLAISLEPGILCAVAVDSWQRLVAVALIED